MRESDKYLEQCPQWHRPSEYTQSTKTINKCTALGCIFYDDSMEYSIRFSGAMIFTKWSNAARADLNPSKMSTYDAMFSCCLLFNSSAPSTDANLSKTPLSALSSAYGVKAWKKRLGDLPKKSTFTVTPDAVLIFQEAGLSYLDTSASESPSTPFCKNSSTTSLLLRP